MIDKIKNVMEEYTPKIYGQHIESAVLLPLIQIDNEWHVLYEVRSRAVSQAGDSSFPGGKIEKGETNEEAAIRETMEELNLKRENIRVFGEMDYIVSENLIIYCFVGEIVGVDVEDIQGNIEVEKIYTVPLQHLLETKPKQFSVNFNPTLEKDFTDKQEDNAHEYKLRERAHKIPYYEIENHSLWGFTANLTERFVKIIQG